MGKEIVTVHISPPKGFSPKVEAAACHVVCGSVSLWLRQPVGKPEPGSWVMPGGKLDPGETPLEAVAREVMEETGILQEVKKFKFLGTYYVIRPETHFVFHVYRTFLEKLPLVHLSHEHPEFRWATEQDLKQMKLIQGTKEVLWG
jgi:8-oxo-dGTP diphosphatase